MILKEAHTGARTLGVRYSLAGSFHKPATFPLPYFREEHHHHRSKTWGF